MPRSALTSNRMNEQEALRDVERAAARQQLPGRDVDMGYLKNTLLQLYQKGANPFPASARISTNATWTWSSLKPCCRSFTRRVHTPFVHCYTTPGGHYEAAWLQLARGQRFRDERCHLCTLGAVCAGTVGLLTRSTAQGLTLR
jgi:hypothetical protein